MPVETAPQTPPEFRTAPKASPQSNGMSEAFVNTMRRDYIAGADLSTAEVVFEQVPAWLADYNAVAPHSALGLHSPPRIERDIEDFVKATKDLPEAP